MTILSKEQRQLLFEVIQGERLPDELDWDLDFDASDTNQSLLVLLDSSIHSGNADEVERAYLLSYSYFENDSAFATTAIPVLVKLLASPFHHQHEDIISTLQQIRDERAVSALHQAALINHEYLNYDDTNGLARKCTWALADTGGADAYSKLLLLATNGNPQIAHYAQKRLDSWQKELPRKAHKFTP